LLAIPAESPAQGIPLPPPDQAQQTLQQAVQQNPGLAEVIRQRIQNSGMTPEQVRARLAAGGYPPDLRRLLRTDHPDESQPPDRHDGGARSQDRAIVSTVQLEDNGPEGAASDGRGRFFINNEGTSTMQVIDGEAMKALASWPLAPCEGPTGIAYDRATNRIFAGCGKTSVVVDATTGKIVATIANGDGVDALGWDPVES